MDPCPDETEVAELLGGRLAEREKARVLAHAADCDLCRELLAELSRGTAGRSDAPPNDDPWLSRYRLVRPLGAGGMGVVYLAYDRELDRQVALKMLRDGGDAEGDSDASRRRALVREARAMAKLNHPNVVRVLDVAEDGARVFVTMELATGGTLRTFLDASPRSFGEIAKLFTDAGRGLQAAHGAGLIHRDFKPENVLLNEGAALVTDFGLARRIRDSDPVDGALADTATASEGAASVTATNNRGAAGTLRYMAPEQLRGEPLDVRADVFSFAVAFWEASYDERPFPGTTVGELLAAMAHGPRAPTKSTRPVPRAVRQALERALAFDRESRPASMSALLAEWTAASPRRRAGPIALAAALLAIGAIGAAAVALRRSTPLHDPAVAREQQDAGVTSLGATSASAATSATTIGLVTTAGSGSGSGSGSSVPRKALLGSPHPSDSRSTNADVPAPSASVRGQGGVFVRPPF